MYISLLLKRLKRDTRGISAVEYGFLLALIALAILASVTEVAKTTRGMWNDTAEKVVASSTS